MPCPLLSPFPYSLFPASACCTFTLWTFCVYQAPLLAVLNPAVIHNCTISYPVLIPPSLFLISITRKCPHQSPLQKRKHKSRTLHFCSTQSLNRRGHLILLVTRLGHRDERTLLTHLKILSLSCSAICLS